MNYIITSLGCKVNQYEIQAIESVLISHGHKACIDGDKADVVIVNTCAVTAESERKSRQVIRKLKSENPEAIIAVSGCYSQLKSEKISELGVNIIFGTNDKLKFVEEIEKAAKNKKSSIINVDNPFRRREFEQLSTQDYLGRTRAMLKIQDGCVNFCTYCIIPYTRGALRSLPLDKLKDGVKFLSDQGYTEVVLTGIEIASYGKDLQNGIELKDAVIAALEISDNIRIRLGSLEPTVITENFCSSLSKYRNLCNHFHLSLQSGCDKTLKNMNRKYNCDEFRLACNLLRKYFPGCSLTADVIAGFPGETEEDHNITKAFLSEIEFAKIHVFPYSRRTGTPADKMTNQLTTAVKNNRAKEIQTIAAGTEERFIRSNLGKDISIIFESEENGIWSGHSDTYIQCKSYDSNIVRGKIYSCIAYDIDGYSLICKLK